MEVIENQGIAKKDLLHYSENREFRLKSEFENYGALVASSNLDDNHDQSFNFSEEEKEAEAAEQELTQE